MYLNAPKFYFGMNFKLQRSTLPNLISTMAKTERNPLFFRQNFAGWFCEAYYLPHIFGWRMVSILEDNYTTEQFTDTEFVKTFIDWYAGVCANIVDRTIQLDVLFQEETKTPLGLLHNPYKYEYDVSGMRKHATINTDAQMTLGVQ